MAVVKKEIDFLLEMLTIFTMFTLKIDVTLYIGKEKKNIV